MSRTETILQKALGQFSRRKEGTSEFETHRRSRLCRFVRPLLAARCSAIIWFHMNPTFLFNSISDFRRLAHWLEHAKSRSDLSKRSLVVLLVTPVLLSRFRHFSDPDENLFLCVSPCLCVPIGRVLIGPEPVLQRVVQ
jgi:hypothetical protein